MIALVLALSLAAPEEVHEIAAAPPARYPFASKNSLIFKKPIERDGFHFQIMFGIGGGKDTDGVHHAMEIGGTLPGTGVTLALLHTFVQNAGVIGPERGPDLVGGWMAEVKFPIFFPEIELKFALGLGGLHDQSNGIRVIPGVGWAYGVDWQFPFATRSGATIGFTFVHAWIGLDHYFTASVGTGYTFF